MPRTIIEEEKSRTFQDATISSVDQFNDSYAKKKKANVPQLMLQDPSESSIMRRRKSSSLPSSDSSSKDQMNPTRIDKWTRQNDANNQAFEYLPSQDVATAIR